MADTGDAWIGVAAFYVACRQEDQRIHHEDTKNTKDHEEERHEEEWDQKTTTKTEPPKKSGIKKIWIKRSTTKPRRTRRITEKSVTNLWH